MIIYDLDILEVVPEASQVAGSSFYPRARARAGAFGRLTRIFTWRQTATSSDSNFSSSASSSISFLAY